MNHLTELEDRFCYHHRHYFETRGVLEHYTLRVYLPNKDEPDWDKYFWKTQILF